MPYLTPDDSGGTYVCRRIRFRAELAGAITGALETLTKDYAWEAFGDLTPDETAGIALEALNYYLDSGDACLIGTIVPYLTPEPPDGVLPLVGGTYNDADYPLLAAAWVATDFNNGDGTFNVPDTSGMVLCHIKPADLYLPTYETQIVGETAHVLTEAELTPHVHATTETGVTAADPIAGVPLPAASVASPSLTGSTGGGQAHNNVQPSFGVNFGVVAR